MLQPIRGRAWCFDGILDVDWEFSPIEDQWVIRDAERLGLTYGDQMRELAKHCLVKLDPDFPSKVRPGDILVGNRGVGWGHGHDRAVLALKGCGVAAVVCEVAGANFRRNCINHGLPVAEVPGVFSQVQPGNELELDLRGGQIANHSTGVRLRFNPYPEFILDILDAGGVYPLLNRQVRE